MSIGGRVGQFFFFVGLIVLILFLITAHNQQPYYSYFCISTLLLILGSVQMWKGRNPPAPMDRFNLIRKRRNKSKVNEKEEK